MIEREKLLVELESLSEEKFRIFNEKIVHTSKYRVIGTDRTYKLRFPAGAGYGKVG